MLPLPRVRFHTQRPVAAVKTPHPSVPVVERFFIAKTNRLIGICNASVARVRFPRRTSCGSQYTTSKCSWVDKVLAETDCPWESVILPSASDGYLHRNQLRQLKHHIQVSL